MKNEDFYNVSAELANEFGEVGSATREEALVQAWKEYNAQILLDARKKVELRPL
ncbi:hypothetical protein LJC35_04055 [Parabacteroides sp. OttesenSCG-928-N08]|nr:hypothetical protein [Parabacteroides sp. OttesenSCG-928-N08]